MELLFNELSTISLSSDRYAANEKMKAFSGAVAAARERGFRNIRSHFDSHQIQLADGYTLHNWLTSRDIPEVYRNILYGMIVLPFIREDDEEIEEKYVDANYFFEDEANGIKKTECLGLASAYLYETLSISLQSNKVWTCNGLDISIESNGSTQSASVINIYSSVCFDVPNINDFVEQLGEVRLVESPLNPEDKKVHLSDHHGKKDLVAFWKKLKNCPYIIEGRSTNWGGKRFIRRIDKNGAIEIVLVDSEREYALWVQTTGRSLRETKAIAGILKDRYE